MAKIKIQVAAAIATITATALPALAEMPYVTKLKAQQVASLTFPVPYAPNEEAFTTVAFVWEEFDTPYVAKLKAQQIAGLTFPVPYMPRYAPATAFGQLDGLEMSPPLLDTDTRVASR